MTRPQVHVSPHAAATLAILLPLAITCAILFHFSLTLPIFDDYFTVLTFAVHFNSIPDLPHRILYIVQAQYMEYKFVFEHLILAADLSLTHRIHFAFLNLIGDLFLPAIFWIVWEIFAPAARDRNQRLILFVPVSLLFFSFSYIDCLSSPSASLDYLPTLFFSFAAIYLLTLPESSVHSFRFALACGCALLAYASAVNAFLLFPIGLVLLLRARATLRILSWCVGVAIGLFPYFYSYTRLDHHGSKVFWRMPVFFLSFLGCAGPVHQVAIPLGLTILVVLTWATRNGFARSCPASFWCAVWILLCAAMTSYGRSSMGLEMSLSGRYRIFSLLLLIFCYQAVLLRVVNLPAPRQRLLYRLAVGAALFLFLRGDQLAWRYRTATQADVNVGITRFKASPATQSPMYFANPEHERTLQESEEQARQAALQAEAAGLYRLPGR
jgi:hypothetical protein